MTRSILTTIALTLLLTLSASAQEAKKLRVLVTVGGHGFDQKPFYEMLDKLPGISYKKIDLPKDAGLLKPGLEKDYDAILMYDMVKAITPEQQQAFAELLKSGIGVVSWHHNLAAHPEWDEFRKIIGGKYANNDMTIDGKPQKKSNYTEGIDYKIHIADADHPITKGLKDFELHDEVYGSRWISPDAKILLTTDCPKSDPPLAWTTTYGKSKVLYLLPGHGPQAWANPVFQELLVRGLRWTTEK